MNHDARFRDDAHDEASAVVRAYEVAEATECASCGAKLGAHRYDDGEFIVGECCAKRLVATLMLDGVIGRAHYSRRAVEAIMRGEPRDPESIDVSASERAVDAYTRTVALPTHSRWA